MSSKSTYLDNNLFILFNKKNTHQLLYVGSLYLIVYLSCLLIHAMGFRSYPTFAFGTPSLIMNKSSNGLYVPHLKQSDLAMKHEYPHWGHTQSFSTSFSTTAFSTTSSSIASSSIAASSKDILFTCSSTISEIFGLKHTIIKLIK
jgi:hypothetical protein